MSRTAHTMGRRAFRFPRVSGDEPKHTTEASLGLVFSPRERG